MQKTYFLKLSGREEGAYSAGQIAQMFADQRVDRYTPCKVPGGEWKTIDDFLPTLKYGTQLPPATPRQHPPAAPQSSVAVVHRIALVDLDIPFVSMLKLMFKWMAAAFLVFCCFVPAIIIVWAIIMAVFATLINGAMSNLHHP